MKPLQKVVDTLNAIPTPHITTSEWVKDFDDYDDFDNEMSSFLIVAPTGWGVRFFDVRQPQGRRRPGRHRVRPLDLRRRRNAPASGGQTSGHPDAGDEKTSSQ